MVYNFANFGIRPFFRWIPMEFSEAFRDLPPDALLRATITECLERVGTGRQRKIMGVGRETVLKWASG
jgi:hypothetical protein